MIKTLTGSRGIVVQGGNSSYPYVNMNNASAGMVRYNGNNQNFEVYDGSGWMMLSGNYSSVELDDDTQSILAWAKARRAQEQQLEKLCQEHAGIRDLKEKLDIMVALVTKDLEKHNQKV